MQQIFIITLLSVLLVSNVEAAEHHSGHGGMMGSSSGSGCIKPKLAKFLPEHLATVAPESEISFVALNIQHPSQIAVKIKNIPVEIVSEFKEPYYLIKTKLPANLRNTAARINIKINAKSAACEAEGGWLVKITE